MIFQIALNVLMFVLGVTVVLALLAPVLWIVGIVFAILAGMAANRGEWYEIPVIGKFARQQTGV